MIRHVVFFRLASSEAERAADIRRFAAPLEALVGVIPGLRSLTVGADIGLLEANWHAVLISEHDDREALAVYANHPAHIEAATIVRSLMIDRATVDYEV
ncbi:MAG: Dabb family protein [Microcella sp.]